MLIWKAWVIKPVGLIKSGRKRKRFEREYLDYCRKCFVRANINNQTRSLSYNLT